MRPPRNGAVEVALSQKLEFAAGDVELVHLGDGRSRGDPGLGSGLGLLEVLSYS